MLEIFAVRAKVDGWNARSPEDIIRESFVD